MVTADESMNRELLAAERWDYETSAPKGQPDLAQGFNPGSDVFMRCALKGH